MQQDGNMMYDCVLVDADSDTTDNMIGFVQQVFNLQPHTTVMIMVSRQRLYIDLMLLKEYSSNIAVAFMFKPCNAHILSGIRDHVAQHRMQIGEFTANTSEEKPNIAKKKCT